MNPRRPAAFEVSKLLIVLCSTIAARAVFGQTTYTWTGAANGTNFATAGNWDPNGLPSGGPQDTAQWDGVTTTNLLISYDTGLPVTGFGSLGINLVLTANQTNPVQIVSSVLASANLAVFGITNNSANAVFSLGDAGANVLNLIWRPGNANQLHDLVNNSASANIVHPNVRFQSGGGTVHVLSFGGTGDWRLTNNLSGFSASTMIQKTGPGTLYWNGPSLAAAKGTSSIGSPMAIHGGTVMIQNSTVLSNGTGNTGSQNIANNGTVQYDAVAQSLLLSGVISGGGLLKVSSGTLTLSGANTYSGGTIITAGTLQVGAGGTNGTIGSGSVTNNSVLIFNRSDNVTFGCVINGMGSVVKTGSGALTLSAANSYTGSTTVSNGTLIVSSVGGDMNVRGGTLVSSGVGNVSALNVAGNMTISSGTVLVALNKSLSPSNSIVSVAGSLSNSGGTSIASPDQFADDRPEHQLGQHSGERRQQQLLDLNKSHEQSRVLSSGAVIMKFLAHIVRYRWFDLLLANSSARPSANPFRSFVGL